MSQSGGNFRRGYEPAPSLLNHYRGHRDSILSIKFHPNLQNVFTGGADGFAMSWNYKTKQQTRALRFEGHTGPINEVGLSKCGELMVTASNDATVRVWVPVVTGEFFSFKGHSAAVRSATFSPIDSSRIASTGDDKTVKIWSLMSQKNKNQQTKFRKYDFIGSYTNHTNWIRSVRFSKDGNLLCTASDDKTVRLFDIRTKECTHTMECPVGLPNRAEFNPSSNNYIGVSTSEKGFLIYETRKLSVIQIYEKLSSTATNSFAFHPSGDFAVCVFDDACIKILDLIEGRPIFTLFGPREALYAVDFSDNGCFFATGGKDKELLIWEPTLLPYEGGENLQTPQESSTNSLSLLSRSSSRSDSSL